MNLEHDFVVPLGPEEVFHKLTDLQSIAPCLPGATINSIDGDDFVGQLAVKVGPLGLAFHGTGKLLEQNRDAGRVVIAARGSDPRGGAAEATVTAQLRPTGAGTQVHVLTDLTVSGRAAQFGGSVIREVSSRVFEQFADNLSAVMLDSIGAAAADRAAPRPEPRSAELNALEMLRPPAVVREYVRPAAWAIVAFVVGYLMGRDRARG